MKIKNFIGRFQAVISIVSGDNFYMVSDAKTIIIRRTIGLTEGMVSAAARDLDDIMDEHQQKVNLLELANVCKVVTT